MEDEIGEFDIHRNETNRLKVDRGVDYFSNKEKFTYCCVWDEFNNSLGGNEIISCIYKIL